METKQIITEIDAEISRLQQAKALLIGTTIKRGPGKPAASSLSPKKRQLSPEARARIVAAQKARWAKVRKATK
jgi:hypothetical protein